MTNEERELVRLISVRYTTANDEPLKFIVKNSVGVLAPDSPVLEPQSFNDEIRCLFIEDIFRRLFPSIKVLVTRFEAEPNKQAATIKLTVERVKQ